jgi:PLP dependent protein
VNRIQENLERVKENIEKAASSVGRRTGDVQLVVVTKGQPIDTLEITVSAGVRWIGENYLEEALPKMVSLGHIDNLEWHMIGHVQSRKAKLVSECFDWVHSVDSVKLARRLDRYAGENDRRLPVLLECNVSGEGSKFGWQAWDESGWESFALEIEPIYGLGNLDLRGLMTVPPYSIDPEIARPYFKRLRKLQEFLKIKYPGCELPELSMGMSLDYIVAIQEGATIVRIGTAILGERA